MKYKNSQRTHLLIKKTFFELLEEKALERITVSDIAKRSGVSRNTFYSHYRDVNGIMEEFQSEALGDMERIILEGMEYEALHNPLPMLKKIISCVQSRENEHKLLLSIRTPVAVIRDMKARHIDNIVASPRCRGIENKKGLRIFFDVMISGFLELALQNLRGETEMSLEEIAEETCRIYMAGIQLYK